MKKVLKWNRIYSFSFSLEPQTEVNWEVFAAAELTEFDELSEEFLEDEDEKEANEKKWTLFFRFDSRPSVASLTAWLVKLNQSLELQITFVPKYFRTILGIVRTNFWSLTNSEKVLISRMTDNKFIFSIPQ